MPKNGNMSRCCGGGGDLKISKPSLSTDIGARRLNEVIGVGAKILVSGCPACELQFSDVAQKQGTSIQILNIADLVVRAMTV